MTWTEVPRERVFAERERTPQSVASQIELQHPAQIGEANRFSDARSLGPRGGEGRGNLPAVTIGPRGPALLVPVERGALFDVDSSLAHPEDSPSLAPYHRSTDREKRPARTSKGKLNRCESLGARTSILGNFPDMLQD